MTDAELIEALRNSKGWPTLGNAAADRIESLLAQCAELSQQCDGVAQAAMNNGQALLIAESKLAEALGTLELIVLLDTGESAGMFARLAKHTLQTLKLRSINV